MGARVAVGVVVLSILCGFHLSCDYLWEEPVPDCWTDNAKNRLHCPNTTIYAAHAVAEDEVSFIPGHLYAVKKDGQVFFVMPDGSSPIELTREASIRAVAERARRAMEGGGGFPMGGGLLGTGLKEWTPTERLGVNISQRTDGTDYVFGFENQVQRRVGIRGSGGGSGSWWEFLAPAQGDLVLEFLAKIGDLYGTMFELLCDAIAPDSGVDEPTTEHRVPKVEVGAGYALSVYGGVTRLMGPVLNVPFPPDLLHSWDLGAWQQFYADQERYRRDLDRIGDFVSDRWDEIIEAVNEDPEMFLLVQEYDLLDWLMPLVFDVVGLIPLEECTALPALAEAMVDLTTTYSPQVRACVHNGDIDCLTALMISLPIDVLKAVDIALGSTVAGCIVEAVTDATGVGAVINELLATLKLAADFGMLVDSGDHVLDEHVFARVDVPLEDPCETMPCGTNGRCFATLPAGTYTCECDPCFHAGVGDDDQVTCLPGASCEGNFCDGHGTCELRECIPWCSCEAGYGGDGTTCTNAEGSGLTVRGSVSIGTWPSGWTGATVALVDPIGQVHASYRLGLTGPGTESFELRIPAGVPSQFLVGDGTPCGLGREQFTVLAVYDDPDGDGIGYGFVGQLKVTRRGIPWPPEGSSIYGPGMMFVYVTSGNLQLMVGGCCTPDGMPFTGCMDIGNTPTGWSYWGGFAVDPDADAYDPLGTGMFYPDLSEFWFEEVLS